MKKIIFGILVFGLINLVANDVEQKCNDGDPISCRKAADKYYDKQTNPNDPKAYEFYKKGCELNDDNCCLGAGLRAEKNNNIEQAKNYYKKACKLGEPLSCSKLKKLN